VGTCGFERKNAPTVMVVTTLDATMAQASIRCLDRNADAVLQYGAETQHDGHRQDR
jgi:hypothetical protein